MLRTAQIGRGASWACVMGVLGAMGAAGSSAHGAIVVATFSGSMTFEASSSQVGVSPVNETWSSTSTDPFTVSREYVVPLSQVEPFGRSAGTMTTTYGSDLLRVVSFFTAEASCFAASDGSATARSVCLVTMTFNITQAGDYAIRGGGNVTSEGFGSILYNTQVNMTGPVNVHLPSIDGPFNPDTLFVRTLPVGTYTLSTLATVAADSVAGNLAGVSGSTKFEIVPIPSPGVVGVAMVVGGIGLAARRRRECRKR